MNAFADAAFGADPGRWPLPAATTPEEHWQRAVACGGQGRYGSAVAELETMMRLRPGARLASLLSSTRASFVRQLGGHAAARTWDGRAWALAGTDVEAGVDALVGLAADALGIGRFALSDRLLQRAAGLLGTGGPGRLPVRLGWVAAELAMAMGDGAAAVRPAERAVEFAEATGSARHAVKSQVVLAASLCSIGDHEAARRVADAALADSERLGLIPLSWALACLLADVGSAARSPTDIAAARDRFAAIVRVRGGMWTAR